MSTPSAHRRPALVALVVLAAAACLGLGWWQWTRYQSGSGSFQNLGYALQWPLFAGFVVYAYRRVVRLEGEAAGAAASGSTTGATEPGATEAGPPRAAVLTELPADVLPARRSGPAARPDAGAAVPSDPELADPELADYNAYLAALDRDTRRTTP